MNRRIPRILIEFAAFLSMLCALLITSGAVTESRDEEPVNLMGSWHVTSAQTSLIISVEPNHQALVLGIQEGSHSMQRTSWRPFHGGVLIEGIPRIRLWPGRDGRDDELRAEMESIPELGFDPNENFHDHFFMSRIEFGEPPEAMVNRPVPERWTQETLGAEWNATAGREPLP